MNDQSFGTNDVMHMFCNLLHSDWICMIMNVGDTLNGVTGFDIRASTGQRVVLDVSAWVFISFLLYLSL